PKEGTFDDFARHAYPKVLPTSNGFLGNLHEIVDTGDVGADEAPDVVFKAESDPHSDLWAMLDGEPNTWMEYENTLVSESDRRNAGNLDFSYRTRVDLGVASANAGATGVETVDWAAGPSNGVLRLDLEFDLGSPQ